MKSRPAGTDRRLGDMQRHRAAAGDDPEWFALFTAIAVRSWRVTPVSRAACKGDGRRRRG